MRRRTVMLLGLMMIGLVATGWEYACSGYTVCLEIPVAGLSSLEAERRRSEILQQQRERLTRRLKKRVTILKALADGRLSLLEAAAWFKILDAHLTEYDRQRAMAFCPGRSEGERMCRRVIFCADLLFGGHEVRECQELHARLEAELQQLLRTSDVVLLPEIPSD